MDWGYIIAMILMSLVVNGIASAIRHRRNRKNGTAGGVQIICCGKCGGELRRGALPSNVLLYGSPIRKCPHCRTDYVEMAYREIALEGVGQGSACFDAGSREQEEAASRQRLSDSGYIHRLYVSDYGRKSPRNAENLRALAGRRVRPLLERMTTVTDLGFREFKLKDADACIDRLNYAAHDAAAVTRVVKAVLAHYGLPVNGYTIEVNYAAGQASREGGTLGTFTAIGSGGRIRMEIDPEYSEYDTVVAVALHECAHAFLNARRIRCTDNNENERLTDVAAIYMGGGKYILRGNFPPNGRRVGYLSKVECEVAQKLVTDLWADRAGRESDEREQLDRQWAGTTAGLRELIGAVEVIGRDLHPGRVVREKTIQAGFYGLWQAGEAKRQEAAALLGRVGSGAKLNKEALRRAVGEAQKLEAPLREFEGTLQEWQEAEAYQQGLPASALEAVMGIGPLVEQGNAFALLEMIRFWHGCPATRRDARVYYQRLLTAGDAQSLCALGLCSREGL